MAAASAWCAQAQPNVLLIQADDLGYDDLGRNNPAACTPMLDGLAEQSARGEDFCVHIKCAPSRASLLTGRYFLRTGLWGVHGGRDYLRTDETTLGDVFQQAGYDTGMVGKWHVGLGDRYYPWDRGFRVAHMASLYNYTAQEGAAEASNGLAKTIDGWAEEYFTDRAIAFIREPRDRPFFLYMAYMSPHAPWRSPPEYQQVFRDRGQSEGLSAFNGMVHYLDHQVGRLLDALEASGQADDTIVVFLSDNGPIGNGGSRPDGQAGGLNTRGKDLETRNPHSLRGSKGQVWQNGIRSVLYLRWPEHISPGTVEPPLNVQDLFPTLLELAGLQAPADGKPLDGQSFAPLLLDPEGQEAQSLRSALENRPSFYSTAEPTDPSQKGMIETYDVFAKSTDPSRFEYEDMKIAVRRGPLKLVRVDEHPVVFNIEKQPRENMKLDRPALSNELDALGRVWWGALLLEPTSFERPVLYIDGDSSSAPSIIQMRAADSLTGVQLSAHAARGWDRVGDGLTIKVEVGRPGRYHAYLLSEAAEPTGAKFEIAFGDLARAQAVIDRPIALTAEQPIFGYDRDTAIDLGEIAFSLPGPMTLTITLIEWEIPRADAVKSLNHLVLERLD